MATANRSIVAGWDPGNSRPKGVATAKDIRASLAMVADRAGIAYGERDAQVTLPSSSMGIAWTGFNAVIPSPGGGWYTPRVQAGSIALQPGDATYPRQDIVYVRQWDYEISSAHPGSEVEIGVVSGTPSATPQLPAVPDGALAAFTVKIPKGATRGVDIGASNVTRAPWSYPAAPPYPEVALPVVNKDITSMFTLADKDGWIKTGDWYARQVGNIVQLQIIVHGPWGAQSTWVERPLLNINAAVKPYHPNRGGGTMTRLTTSNNDGGAYLMAYPNQVRLGIRGSTTWSDHAQSLVWIVQ